MANHYLISGGAGFIGSHLVENLLKDNNKIVLIDNFNNFYDPAIKKRNLQMLRDLHLQKKFNSKIELDVVMTPKDLENTGLEELGKKY